MAQRRMFSRAITESDAFTDMPLSSQTLYFHLGMSADDDGFVNNPRRIQRCIGASDDDLKSLAAKRFIIPFESGVIAIKHWKINNFLRKDRYRPTTYQDEYSCLSLNNNGAYSLPAPNDVSDVGQPLGIPMVNAGKDSLDKASKEDILSGANAPVIAEIVGYLNERIGSNYKSTTKSTARHINARLAEGYTVEDFKRVIDNKAGQWLNDSKMAAYLRPETLFGTKFESYLNERTANHVDYSQYD